MIKIGEIFEYNGEWYQCVEGKTICSECDLRNIICQRDTSINNPFKECSGNYRTDKKNIIFKKLEKVGEPYKFQKRTIQTYKLYTEPFISVDMDFINTYLNGSDTIDIIIKQNIEDMEEKKLNLKPFDIQKAREGKPVCTRDGRKARILCYDLKGAEYPIVAAVEKRDSFAESVFSYDKNGRFDHNTENNNDLIMLLEKKEGWVNMYKNGLLGTRVHDTKKEALDNASPKDYIATVKIKWEE